MDTSVALSASQFLTFRLDQELFAIEVNKVREVLEFTAMTKVPCTPDYMRGVINLRGSVVPVLDLRLKLGLGATQMTVDTCVVIAETAVDGESTVLGALVDAVQEVIDLDAAQVAPPPRIGHRIDSAAIRAMGKRDERFFMILDLDRVFTVQDPQASLGSREFATGPASSSLPEHEQPAV